MTPFTDPVHLDTYKEPGFRSFHTIWDHCSFVLQVTPALALSNQTIRQPRSLLGDIEDFTRINALCDFWSVSVTQVASAFSGIGALSSALLWVAGIFGDKYPILNVWSLYLTRTSFNGLFPRLMQTRSYFGPGRPHDPRIGKKSKHTNKYFMVLLDSKFYDEHPAGRPHDEASHS